MANFYVSENAPFVLRVFVSEHFSGKYGQLLLKFSLQTSTYVSSHFPEYWNNPEEFNPYRFDDEELVKRYFSRNTLFSSGSLGDHLLAICCCC